MDVINALYDWTDNVLFVGLLVLRAWALVDCVTRRADAFPAVDKLTKPAWAAMLALGFVFGTLIFRSPLSIFSLVTAVMAAVYLADVRPAVREISEGR